MRLPALNLLLVLGLFSGGFASGQEESLSVSRRLNGSATQKAFAEAEEAAFDSTVRLMRNGKLITHGTVVSEEGHLLTKASACVGAREAVFADGSKYPVRIRRRDKEADLALLTILAKDKKFVPVQWAGNTLPEAGNWMISADPRLKGLKLGVASGIPRPIKREGGVIGVILKGGGEDGSEAVINKVMQKSAASAVGLRRGDIISSVNGRPAHSVRKVQELISAHDPGDVVRLEVKRNEKNLTYSVTLGHRSVTFELFNRNLRMSGPTSKRKDNFPMIIQHDLPLPPQAMGGPVLNVEGKTLGVNVARVDRVTTYALPAKLVREVLGKMRR